MLRAAHSRWMSGVWKFVVEIAQEGGGLLPQICFVNVADENDAFTALKTKYPSANKISKSELATSAEIAETGGAFFHEEIVRCVRL